MTFSGVIAVIYTLRYFNEFGKRAFQLITALPRSTELIDQELTSITQIER